MEEARIDGRPHEILLLGVCEGLAGEARAAAQAIRAFTPSALALALDEELTQGMESWTSSSDLGKEDTAYAEGLSKWGEVKLPPPEYPNAAREAKRLEIETHGVDLSEVAYLDLYTEQVTMWDLFKRSFTVKRALKGTGDQESPEAFCRAFDAHVNQGAFERLETRRERKIAENVLALSTDGPVAVVLPVARLDGVAQALSDL